MSGDVHEKSMTMLSEIHAAETSQSLFSALDRACGVLGFDAFMLSCHRQSKAELVMNPIFTTYTEEFMNDYERLNWLDDDVLIARTIGSSRPFVWDGSSERYSDVRSQSFLEFLHENRLATGIMVPLAHGPGYASLMSLDAYRPMQLPPDLVRSAQCVAEAAQAKAEMLGLCANVSADEAIGLRALSGRQLEILKWISDGKSNTDIATIMNLRTRAVHYHVSRILLKLRVATRLQAAQVFFAWSDHQTL